MKKIECIIEKRFLDPLLKFLDDHQISGYSVIEIMKGRGPRHGSVQDLGFISITKNFFVISLCSQEVYNNIKQPLSDYVKNCEGLIYFYDIEKP